MTSSSSSEPQPARPKKTVLESTFKIGGMTCGACTSAVESAFKGVDGVEDVSVSLMLGEAVVQHDPTCVSKEKAVELIEDRGFDAELYKSRELRSEAQGGNEDTLTTLSVQGMTCGACTSAVENGLTEAKGVKSATISLLSERAVVEHDSTISPNDLAEIIADRGFDASVVDTKSAVARDESPRDGISHEPTTTTVAITGMTCGACTSAVEAAVKGQPGLLRFNISLLAERAVIIHDPKVLSPTKIAELIEDTGFDASIVSSHSESFNVSSDSINTVFNIYGLHEPAQGLDLEEVLSELPGVSSVEVEFGEVNSTASITYVPFQVGLRTIAAHIEKEGYGFLLANTNDNKSQLESLAKTREILQWRRAFLISLCFAVPVMLIGMIFPMFLPSLDILGKGVIIPGLNLRDLACMALTIPVQFGVGKRFYVSGFKSLKHKAPTMDVLVILGTSTAFFFSILAMIISILCEPHAPPQTFFETSAMLITFISLGRWMENRAKGQTSHALSQLMTLAPSTTTIYEDPIVAEKAAEEKEPTTPDAGAEARADTKTILTDLIEVGDVVRLTPGDKVPADGVITRGESYLDESMITGEAIPVYKGKDQQVMAGTVNGSGWIEFRVMKAGNDTQLSQIVNLVLEAQTKRAPIQQMADVVAGYFVPVIILLGLITFVVWMILSHALKNPPPIFQDQVSGGSLMVCLKLCISVIVFACPCALGLSTPTAVMVGTGVGASHGILFKGGAALEAATKVTTVAFDKTGTLTQGKMSVAKVQFENSWLSDDRARRLWWSIVGLAEMNSEHPIGNAIVKASKNEIQISDNGPIDGTVLEFQGKPGKGITALVEPISDVPRQQYRVLIGNPDFLNANGVSIPVEDLADAEASSEEDSLSSLAPTTRKSLGHFSTGATRIYVAIDGAYSGSFSLQDTIKPTAAATIAALHRMGLGTALITGDALAPALAVATSVGIPEHSVYASVVPSEKQVIVNDLQEQHDARIAMVGDGINDSPVLATASVGIALASGTDVAVETADIVLMRPEDLLTVPASLCLARSIFNRIKLNLIWACLYNAIGLPFAMGVLLPFGGVSLHPMASGAAMTASSVSVVVSSLLLRLWKVPRWLNATKLLREAEDGKITAAEHKGDEIDASTKRGLLYVSARFIRRIFAAISGRSDGSAKDADRVGDYVPLQTFDSSDAV